MQIIINIIMWFITSASLYWMGKMCNLSDILHIFCVKSTTYAFLPSLYRYHKDAVTKHYLS